MKPPHFLGKLIYIITKPIIRFIIKGSKRSYVIIRYKDTIVVTKNWLGLQKKWQLPGGGIKKSEDPKNAAIREIKEEIGLNINAENLISIGNKSFKSQKENFEFYLYQIILSSMPNIKINNKEIVDAKLIKLKDIDKNDLDEKLLLIKNN